MTFERVSKEEAQTILDLYHSVLGTPFCRWSEHYPLMENVEDDLSRNGLFCLKENGEIIAAISHEKDDDVTALPFWNPALQPSMEIARICVRSDYQGQGLAGKMIEYMMDYGRSLGMKSIIYLVSKHNLIAQKAYSRLEFTLAGECEMYEDEYYCFEKEL